MRRISRDGARARLRSLPGQGKTAYGNIQKISIAIWLGARLYLFNTHEADGDEMSGRRKPPGTASMVADGMIELMWLAP
jgi:hypothetical protein